MAIKVKHDVNAAPMAVASAAGGKARRAMETARLIQNQKTQATQGAHASPISPGQSHAPTLQAHAPTPVNWELQRRENAAQEAARAALAEQNNAAAKERAQMGIDADAAKLKSQQEFTTERDKILDQFQMDRDWRLFGNQTERDSQLNQLQTDRDRALAEQRQNEWDRQHGVLRKEREADLIAAGTHEYGYSPEVQREYDRLQREFDEGLQSGRFVAGSQDEKDFIAEKDRQIAALPKTLVPRNDPQGMFKRNTFTDENGRIFTTDGKLVFNPADAETRRLEFQQRQMDAMRQRADRYEQELRKPRLVSRKVDDPLPGQDAYEKVYEERSEDEIQRIMQQHFPQLYPTAQENAVSQPQAQGVQGAQGGVVQPAQPMQAQQTTQAQQQGVSDWKKKLGW